MKWTSMVIACLLTTGCSSTMQNLVGPMDTDPKDLTLEQLEVQNEAIRKVLEPCDTLFGVQTEKARQKAQSAWWLKVIGVTSASIVAPALTAANASANAAWIAGASGTGGAVIAMLDSADSMGISGVATLRSLTQLAEVIGPDIDTAEDIAKPFNERSAAAARAARRCRLQVPSVAPAPVAAPAPVPAPPPAAKH